jgi:hypothetical protein
MAKGNMEIFTFMVSNRRSLDLEMAQKERRLECTKGVLTFN